MRKYVGAALVLLTTVILVVLSPPAQAHGRCYTDANRSAPASSVIFYAHVSCEESHGSITASITLWRRQVGGSWVYIGSNARTESGYSTFTTFKVNRDCRKDYKGIAGGHAEPGNHNPATSTVFLYHSC